MQKQRLKVSVFPSRHGKISFGTGWEDTVSALRQGPLLHCRQKRSSFLHRRNDTVCNSFSYTQEKLMCKFWCPEGRFPNPTWHISFDIRRDLNPRNQSLTGSCKDILTAYTSESPRVPRRRTIAPNHLANIFYHFIFCFSRKKSCELSFQSAAFLFFQFFHD